MASNIILNFILEKLTNEYSLESIIQSYDFKYLCGNNLITFADAQSIENKLRRLDKLPLLIPYHILGACWLKAYHYPKEGDNIYMNNTYKGRARNIGVFTFHLTNEEEDKNLINEIIEIEEII